VAAMRRCCSAWRHLAPLHFKFVLSRQTADGFGCAFSATTIEAVAPESVTYPWGLSWAPVQNSATALQVLDVWMREDALPQFQTVLRYCIFLRQLHLEIAGSREAMQLKNCPRSLEDIRVRGVRVDGSLEDFVHLKSIDASFCAAPFTVALVAPQCVFPANLEHLGLGSLNDGNLRLLALRLQGLPKLRSVRLGKDVTDDRFGNTTFPGFILENVTELYVVEAHHQRVVPKNLPALRRLVLEGDFVPSCRSLVMFVGSRTSELEINCSKCWLEPTVPGQFGPLDACPTLRVLVVHAQTTDLACQYARGVSAKTLERLLRFELKGEACKSQSVCELLAQCFARPFRLERVDHSHSLFHFQSY
jgi:hypothetical protein